MCLWVSIVCVVWASIVCLWVSIDCLTTTSCQMMLNMRALMRWVVEAMSSQEDPFQASRLHGCRALGIDCELCIVHHQAVKHLHELTGVLGFPGSAFGVFGLFSLFCSSSHWVCLVCFVCLATLRVRGDHLLPCPMALASSMALARSTALASSARRPLQGRRPFQALGEHLP